MRQRVISVVTACRDGVEFLDQCMSSVLSQDFDSFEYIVIDGGSTDGSADIIRRHEHRLAYWQSRPDRGLAHAFNQGVDHSTGQWVIFLNADDYFADRTALSRMARHLSRHAEADVVFGRVQLVTRDQAPAAIAVSGRPWRWQEFRRLDTIPHPAAFTARRFFASVGGFSEDLRIAVDYEHYLRAGQALNAVFAPELVARMRVDGMSQARSGVTHHEIKVAQQLHDVWPAAWMADVLQWYRVAREGMGRAVREKSRSTARRPTAVRAGGRPLP